MCQRNIIKTEESWASGHCQEWHRELKPRQRINLGWKWNAHQIILWNDSRENSSYRTSWAAEAVLLRARKWLWSGEGDLSWFKRVAKGAEERVGQWKVWNDEADKIDGRNCEEQSYFGWN